MATFKLPKNVEDVVQPEALPEDWYTLEIVEEPELAPNKKLAAGGPQAEGAGMNIVIKCNVVSEIPEHSGRPFTLWVSFPSEQDKDRFTKMGQSYEDFKMDRIKVLMKAFSGQEPEGDEVDFQPGQRAMFYVVQALGQDGVTVRNDVDIRMAPRAIE